jgi:hypothetical protein
MSLSTVDSTTDDVAIGMTRRFGRGKRTKALYLSPPLSGAIRKIARTEKRSESAVVRELLRFELRRRGMLPSGQRGAEAAIEAREAADNVTAST